jgi:hypothetical protein
MVERRGLENTPWMVIARRPIRLMNSMDVSGMVGFPNKRLPQINDIPRGLFRRVLPYRTQGWFPPCTKPVLIRVARIPVVQGKLIFPLCKTGADTCNQNTCTHSERERAIQAS